jgi:hypothetical protein
MSSLDRPIHPHERIERVPAEPRIYGGQTEAVTVNYAGLSVREHAAITLRVPDSGDPEIDRMIREARRRDAAERAMAAIIAGGFADTVPHDDMDAGSTVAHFAALYADALLAEMEKGR